MLYGGRSRGSTPQTGASTPECAGLIEDAQCAMDLLGLRAHLASRSMRGAPLPRQKPGLARWRSAPSAGRYRHFPRCSGLSASAATIVIMLRECREISGVGFLGTAALQLGRGALSQIGLRPAPPDNLRRVSMCLVRSLHIGAIARSKRRIGLVPRRVNSSKARTAALHAYLGRDGLLVAAAVVTLIRNAAPGHFGPGDRIASTDGIMHERSRDSLHNRNREVMRFPDLVAASGIVCGVGG